MLTEQVKSEFYQDQLNQIKLVQSGQCYTWSGYAIKKSYLCQAANAQKQRHYVLRALAYMFPGLEVKHPFPYFLTKSQRKNHFIF